MGRNGARLSARAAPALTAVKRLPRGLWLIRAGHEAFTLRYAAMRGVGMALTAAA
jgi:hypothetical protein